MPFPKEPKLWYWHISIDTTKAALERLARALICTDSGLAPGKFSRLLPPYEFGRGVSAHLVVQIPDGHQDEFRRLLGPSLISMDPPPRIQLGTDPPPAHDGHPGRPKEN